MVLLSCYDGTPSGKVQLLPWAIETQSSSWCWFHVNDTWILTLTIGPLVRYLSATLLRHKANTAALIDIGATWPRESMDNLSQNVSKRLTSNCAFSTENPRPIRIIGVKYPLDWQIHEHFKDIGIIYSQTNRCGSDKQGWKVRMKIYSCETGWDSRRGTDVCHTKTWRAMWVGEREAVNLPLTPYLWITHIVKGLLKRQRIVCNIATISLYTLFDQCSLFGCQKFVLVRKVDDD